MVWVLRPGRTVRAGRPRGETTRGASTPRAAHERRGGRRCSAASRRNERRNERRNSLARSLRHPAKVLPRRVLPDPRSRRRPARDGGGWPRPRNRFAGPRARRAERAARSCTPARRLRDDLAAFRAAQYDAGFPCLRRYAPLRGASPKLPADRRASLVFERSDPTQVTAILGRMERELGLPDAATRGDFVDLGSGSGEVVFAAAAAHGGSADYARFVGYELDWGREPGQGVLRGAVGGGAGAGGPQTSAPRAADRVCAGGLLRGRRSVRRARTDEAGPRAHGSCGPRPRATTPPRWPASRARAAPGAAVVTYDAPLLGAREGGVLDVHALGRFVLSPTWRPTVFVHRRRATGRRAERIRERPPAAALSAGAAPALTPRRQGAAPRRQTPRPGRSPRSRGYRARRAPPRPRAATCARRSCACPSPASATRSGWRVCATATSLSTSEARAPRSSWPRARARAARGRRARRGAVRGEPRAIEAAALSDERRGLFRRGGASAPRRAVLLIAELWGPSPPVFDGRGPAGRAHRFLRVRHERGGLGGGALRTAGFRFRQGKRPTKSARCWMWRKAGSHGAGEEKKAA